MGDDEQSESLLNIYNFPHQNSILVARFHILTTFPTAYRPYRRIIGGGRPEGVPYRTDTLLENSERSELIIGKLASFASPHSGISLRLAEGQSFGDFTEPKAIVKEPNTEVAKQPRTNGIPFEVRRQAEGVADITETG